MILEILGLTCIMLGIIYGTTNKNIYVLIIGIATAFIMLYGHILHRIDAYTCYQTNNHLEYCIKDKKEIKKND